MSDHEVASEETTAQRSRRPRRLSSRVTMLLRRIHLYIGLFLLPWVFLYGITGAMFNHVGLFPKPEISVVDSARLAETPLADFPNPEELAEQVLEALRQQKPESKFALRQDFDPQFANDIIVQTHADGIKHLVHIDPVDQSAWVATFPKEEKLEPVFTDVRNVRLSPNPYELARKSVPEIMSSAGIEANADSKPQGWSKLNFIAELDGQPTRVTYVLRDGHIDMTKYEGEDGMSNRDFFLRLHTSHGQPPHWNGRMVWSLFVDVMALAMVTWGITGLVMWWQIKRTRLIGGAVIAASLTTAVCIYFSMIHFYATTKL